MIEKLIETTLESEQIKALINDKSYYFQHLLDVKDRYLSHVVSETTIQSIYDNYLNNKTNISFEKFVANQGDGDNEFFNILGELISYLDLNASGKKNWNKYDDNRVVAKAGVRQTHWINHLILLKKDPNHKLPDNIKNALDYAISPMDNLTILSNNHRKLISEILLKKVYNEQTFTNDIIEYFKGYNITPKNKMNYTYIISSIPYFKEIKSIWNHESESKKMPDTEKIFYQFNEYLKNKNYSESSTKAYLGSIKTRTPILYEEKFKTSFSSFKINQEEIEKLIKITHIPFDGNFKGKLTFRDFLNGLLKNKKASNMEENIFDLFEAYLKEHRASEISPSTITAYLEVAKIHIPTSWKETYDEDFDDFEYDYFNLKKLRRVTYSKGFSGQMSFGWFVNDLIEKHRTHIPLNQILYGPPGTGKTYKTKEIAVNIILGEQDRSREEILELYDDLKNQKQISFVTFHQSMSYEDFVEGIKPFTNDNQKLSYDVKKGIFKEICARAKGVSGSRIINSGVDFPKVNYHKMSLGGKNRYQIHKWCIENNKIALGWGDNEDYTTYTKINDWKKFRDKFTEEYSHLVESSRFHIQAMFAFQNMVIGDVVVISLGNHIIDAVGIVEGEYEYDENNEFGFHHLRKVRWLAKNMNASPELFLDKEISQMSIYEFNKQDVKIEKFIEYFHKQGEPNNINQDYVLIIDEINRGNISAIFGELITLLEEDKRTEGKEEITVTLPYSKDNFSVPNNLYLIGTMNTADRSVEALDTALRRRFSFTEIKPDGNILEIEHKKNGIISINQDDINLIELLNSINSRIELLIDKDHKIGHSYFINVLSFEDLVQVFKDKVIPLLEEYFYGDFGKIGLVLGKAFIKSIEKDSTIKFADFNYEDKDMLLEKNIYCFTNSSSWTAKSFISIYENSAIALDD
ncbi:AAA family ATPase [uncultured Algibacter sp.]|uniref:AAA family ATPase n=1 Tax=uncultured Algibacter sp. TaxID=298659 RepID=UPI00261C31AC|nr:AAA family ATPase [uncultured Algibacter sp.]